MVNLRLPHSGSGVELSNLKALQVSSDEICLFDTFSKGLHFNARQNHLRRFEVRQSFRVIDKESPKKEAKSSTNSLSMLDEYEDQFLGNRIGMAASMAIKRRNAIRRRDYDEY